MLMDRIMKVFTFKTEVFAEVENDASFTPTAWGIVAVTRLIGQIAAFLAAPAAAAAAAELTESLGVTAPAMVALTPVDVVTGTIGGLIAFAVGAWVVSFVAKSLFNATVSFDEVVRVMGLASVWGLLGILGIIGIYLPLLGCIVGPIGLVVWVLSIASSAIAIKEALDLDWTKTIITVVIAWIAIFIVTAVLATVFGVFSGMLG
jgi:hypothetical protein